MTIAHVRIALKGIAWVSLVACEVLVVACIFREVSWWWPVAAISIASGAYAWGWVVDAVDDYRGEFHRRSGL